MRHVVEDVSISAHMKLCIWLPLCTALHWNWVWQKKDWHFRPWHYSEILQCDCKIL